MTAGIQRTTGLRKFCQQWVAASAFGLVLVGMMGVGKCQTKQPADAAVNEFKNGGFEEWNAAGVPTGWIFSSALKTAGYMLTADETGPVAGTTSAVVDSTTAKLSGNIFGNLMQRIDARPYRGKTLRFRAAVKTAELSDDGRAQLWFRVDRASAGGRPVIGAFDNMQDRPIREDDWKHFEIVGKIDDDATNLMVGLLLLKTGKAWIDDATLEVVPETTAATAANISAGARPASSGPSAARPNGALDKPQPFFVKWLWLPVIALVLFGLSQSNLGLVQRIAFRFSFAYWLLYSLLEPLPRLIPFSYGYKLNQQYDSLVNKAVHWTANNVLGITQLFTGPTGSGDTTVDYIKLLLFFTLACVIAVVWSAVDWRRTDHPWLKDLLRSYLRYVLAFVMLSYGLHKVGLVSTQFAEPDVDRLMRTYGDSSPMGLVWTFMGASRAYTRFAGLGEVAGALLLIWRRTTILGAAVTFGVMLNVMMLNFCYDVPVKQFSFHLVVMAVYLLLADAPRLANLLIWNQPVDKVSLLPPYTNSRTIWVQRALKAYIIVMGVAWPVGNFIYRERYPVNNRLAQPAFFGTYEVDEFLLDGQPVPPLLTDNTRWKSLTLTRSPFGPGGSRVPTNYFSARMLDRTQRGGPFTLSADQKTLMLDAPAAGTLPLKMTVEFPDDKHLSLTGTANSKTMEVKLHKLNREDFLLMNRGFHWINELPLNR